MLRFLTAGESHGELLMGIIEGMPSGLLIRVTDIDRDLARRQGGYGRVDGSGSDIPLVDKVYHRDNGSHDKEGLTHDHAQGVKGIPVLV